MDGVVDLQILEVATRRGSKRLLNGLARSIKTDAGLGKEVLAAWLDVKMKGKTIFNETREGVDGKPGPDFSIIDERPLPPELLEYSINVCTRMKQSACACH